MLYGGTGFPAKGPPDMGSHRAPQLPQSLVVSVEPWSPGNTHVCSTKTPEFSKLKERTVPLLKPQKKFGIVGWKATAQGVSSEDEKSNSWRKEATIKGG